MVAIRIGEDAMNKLKEFAEKKDWSISRAVRNILLDYLKNTKVEKQK